MSSKHKSSKTALQEFDVFREKDQAVVYAVLPAALGRTSETIGLLQDALAQNDINECAVSMIGHSDHGLLVAISQPIEKERLDELDGSNIKEMMKAGDMLLNRFPFHEAKKTLNALGMRPLEEWEFQEIRKKPETNLDLAIDGELIQEVFAGAMSLGFPEVEIKRRPGRAK